jgi:hypothetical protein
MNKQQEKDFSRDGCTSSADIQYRKEMLNNIRDGHKQGRLITPERFWVYYGIRVS